jgi:hypothetical protein
MNSALLIWEIEDEYENKDEQFKQAMVQAFPSLYEEIYNLNKESSLEGYEQIVPTSQEEFQSINDFLEGLHLMSTNDLEK